MHIEIRLPDDDGVVLENLDLAIGPLDDTVFREKPNAGIERCAALVYAFFIASAVVGGFAG